MIGVTSGSRNEEEVLAAIGVYDLDRSACIQVKILRTAMSRVAFCGSVIGNDSTVAV